MKRPPAGRPSGEDAGSAVDRASQRLRELILQGRFVAGQPLIEADLVGRLAVARSTVRECIRRLETQGLLVARARGLQLRRLNRADVQDLFALREILEAHAANRAAERLREEATSATRRAVREELRHWRASSAMEAAGFSDRNRQLHDTIVRLAGNVHLPRMLDQTLLVLFAAQFGPWLAHASRAHAAGQHVLILEGIEAGDARGAEAEMRRHIRDACRSIEGLPDAAFGEVVAPSARSLSRG